MKVTAESTAKIIELNGVPARVWYARTESDVECFLFVTLVAVANEEEQGEFGAAFQKLRAPIADIDAFPLRLFM